MRQLDLKPGAKPPADSDWVLITVAKRAPISVSAHVLDSVPPPATTFYTHDPVNDEHDAINLAQDWARSLGLDSFYLERLER